MRRLILTLFLTCPLLASAEECFQMFDEACHERNRQNLETKHQDERRAELLRQAQENIRREQAQRDYDATPTNFQPSLGIYPNSDYFFINGEIVRTDKNPQRFIALVKSGRHRVFTKIPLPPGYYFVNPEQLEMYAERLEKEQQEKRGVLDKLKDLF